jgi:hypothetical protein
MSEDFRLRHPRHETRAVVTGPVGTRLGQAVGNQDFISAVAEDGKVTPSPAMRNDHPDDPADEQREDEGRGEARSLHDD